MKRMNAKLLTMLLASLMLLFVSSCKDDKDDNGGTTNIPVLGTDFSYAMDGNNKAVFTTEKTGSCYVTNCKTSGQVTFTDGTCSVTLNAIGTYPFTFTYVNSSDGLEYTSDTFNISITVANLEFLDKNAYWYALCGGQNSTRTWKMDISTEGSMYFDGPVSYSGTSTSPYWSWNVIVTEWPYTDSDGAEHSSYFNWEPSASASGVPFLDAGTITFNGTTGVCTVADALIDEADGTGTFEFDTTTMFMTFSGIFPPFDSVRYYDNEFTDVYTWRVYTLTDSAMQIGIKRATEGGATSEWTCVYNFIRTDLTYNPETFTYSAPVKTSFTSTDLVGTWKYDDVPMGWIAYAQIGSKGTNVNAYLYGQWDTRSDEETTLISWGLSSIDSLFTANDACSFVFNSDGSCTLNGVTNTYSVSNGVVTFGTALDSTEFNFATGWLNVYFSGTTMDAVDVNYYGSATTAYTYNGIWFGQDDGGTQYKAVHMVKQTTK